MKKIIFLMIISLLIGLGIGHVFPIFSAPKEVKADTENVVYSKITNNNDNRENTTKKLKSVEDIEKILMSQNGYTYTTKENATKIFGDKLIQLPEKLHYDFETTGKYFADTNLEEGQTSVGQYWIDADNKKIVMVRQFIPSKDAKEAFKEHLKLSLNNEGNPLYDYPLKLSENVYALMWGPYTELLDGSPFEPDWIKSMIHAYWIKDSIGITVSGINIEKDEFANILAEINSQT